MDLDLTNTNPDLEGFDLEAMTGLGAHRDGSGGGIHQIAWEMRTLRETQMRIDLLRAFVRKHQMLLARLSWQLDVDRLPPVKREDVLFVPEIELNGYVYDKRSVEPSEIAALWPDAHWSRVLPRWESDKDCERDYTTEVDGVTLRIRRAEKLPPPSKVNRFGPCGRVRISKPKN